MTKRGQHDNPSRAVLVAITLAVSTLVWYHGLQTSPVLVDETVRVRRTGDILVQKKDPSSRLENELAETYWRRYPDVKVDPHYGTNGPLGIHGAREHFRQHGKREGRVWGLAPGQSMSQPD